MHARSADSQDVVTPPRFGSRVAWCCDIVVASGRPVIKSRDKVGVVSTTQELCVDSEGAMGTALRSAEPPPALRCSGLPMGVGLVKKSGKYQGRVYDSRVRLIGYEEAAWHWLLLDTGASRCGCRCG